MKIFLDTADVDEIREGWESGIIYGITTNPTLIRKSRDPEEVYQELIDIGIVCYRPEDMLQWLMKVLALPANLVNQQLLKFLVLQMVACL